MPVSRQEPPGLPRRDLPLPAGLRAHEVAPRRSARRPRGLARAVPTRLRSRQEGPSRLAARAPGTWRPREEGRPGLGEARGLVPSAAQDTRTALLRGAQADRKRVRGSGSASDEPEVRQTNRKHIRETGSMSDKPEVCQRKPKVCQGNWKYIRRSGNTPRSQKRGGAVDPRASEAGHDLTNSGGARPGRRAVRRAGPGLPGPGLVPAAGTPKRDAVAWSSPEKPEEGEGAGSPGVNWVVPGHLLTPRTFLPGCFSQQLKC